MLTATWCQADGFAMNGNIFATEQKMTISHTKLKLVSSLELKMLGSQILIGSGQLKISSRAIALTSSSVTSEHQVSIYDSVRLDRAVQATDSIKGMMVRAPNKLSMLSNNHISVSVPSLQAVGTDTFSLSGAEVLMTSNLQVSCLPHFTRDQSALSGFTPRWVLKTRSDRDRRNWIGRDTRLVFAYWYTYICR